MKCDVSRLAVPGHPLDVKRQLFSYLARTLFATILNHLTKYYITTEYQSIDDPKQNTIALFGSYGIINVVYEDLVFGTKPEMGAWQW